MYYIEETYGNDGFATFVKILRELARTNYHFIDLQERTTTMYLAAKCKVSVDKMEAIIKDLVELGKFDRQLWQEHRAIFCQDFIDSIQDAYKKRSNICVTRGDVFLRVLSKSESFEGLVIPIGVLSGSDGSGCTQRKEKDTIVKDRIEKESIFSENFSSLEDVVIVGDDEQIIEAKSKLIDEMVLWFGFSASYFHKQKSEIMQFVNRLYFDGISDHFHTQWAAYTEYKALAGNPHQLPGFIENWNGTNWVLSLEGFKAQKATPAVDKSIAAQVEKMSKVRNPFRDQKNQND